MSKSKTVFTVMTALVIAFPASAQIGVSDEVETHTNSSDGAHLEGESDINLDIKASGSIKVHQSATGSSEIRLREKSDELNNEQENDKTGENGDGEEQQSKRMEEKSVSDRDVFKGEGFAGIIVTPHSIHINGDDIRAWTKKDEDGIKSRGANNQEISVALEAKESEHVSDINVESDEKTGHGTVVLKYVAQVKFLGFISIAAPLIATSSDSVTAVEVVAPWYIRWFSSTGDDEKAALALASKIKINYDTPKTGGKAK